MSTRNIMTGAILAALGAAAVLVMPASGAPESGNRIRPPATAIRGGIGYFTPASADPRLAALFARGGLNNRGFRFTRVNTGKPRAVTVAVRAIRGSRTMVSDRAQPAAVVAAAQNSGIEPISWNMGAAVGWKRFALSGDVARVDTGPLPGGRERADLGLSYNSRKWSTRVAVAAERPAPGPTPQAIKGGESYSLDVGGSFRLTRNLDLSAGVRYRSDRDRLQPRVDERRDSQAVYVGTAFRF